MIVVISDDFSGAAEIGGIGYRYGLRAEIQMNFDPAMQADLIVIDANTRAGTEAEAIRKTEKILDDIRQLPNPVKLFKKVDSVFRGHIVPEIAVLQKHFLYNRILVLPANPVRGRKIISGHYFVNDISLDKSVFAADPDFPATTALVQALLKIKPDSLPYFHLKRDGALPASGIVTGDIENKTDLKKLVSQTTDRDLCCGAAECFEAYLENQGYAAKQKSESEKMPLPPFTLIITGSTVRNPDNVDLFARLNIPAFPLPGSWQNDQFTISDEEESQWHREVFACLQKNHLATTSINHAVKPVKGIAEVFSNHFVKLIRFIRSNMNKKDIHIGLTGGATASDIARSLGVDTLHVREEVVSGVVIVTSEEMCFTVKPGSYPWPAAFMESLKTK